MNEGTPTGVQIHLTTGHKHWFYQSDPKLVTRICEDLDTHLFNRASLVIEGNHDVTSFPGRSIIGVTVLLDVLPDALTLREAASKTVVTQLSHETFLLRRLQIVTKSEGRRSALLSEIEFTSGERLFLEFNEVAVSGMSERSVLNHLFSRPSLMCRRLDGGFSVWNTAHIVSWSHYPKLDVPENSWRAEAFFDPDTGKQRLSRTL